MKRSVKTVLLCIASSMVLPMASCNGQSSSILSSSYSDVDSGERLSDDTISKSSADASSSSESSSETEIAISSDDSISNAEISSIDSSVSEESFSSESFVETSSDLLSEELLSSETSLDESSETSLEESSSSEEGPTSIYPLPEVDYLEMPVFFIDTADRAPIVSKEEYLGGSLSIRNSNDYDADYLPLQIRGRGNYSWSGTEKKSYRIKFESKYQPLGQGKGKAKSWTLLAVHCDKSMLRTDAAFHFASKLNNLPFVSSSSFVELYLNGAYQGVYELCDQIQVNKYRVNIDDSGEEPDIGYLVELDRNASEDVIRLSSWETYEVKSDYMNQAQLDFITDYMNQCYEAIVTKDKAQIEALIEIPSMVDAYLVEELFKNLDVGWGSFYYTKPKGDKLYFGPVWDFDLCAGNADADDQDPDFPSYQYTYVGNSYFNYMQQHLWYTYLREADWFNECVAARFEEVKEDALETVSHIQSQAETLHESFLRNFKKWKIWFTKINREPKSIMRIKSFDGQVEYLCNWLTQRIEWLDGYYHGENEDLTDDYWDNW